MEDQRKKDLGDLKALSICHYVVAGLTALFSCMFLLHVGMGLGMVFHPEWFQAASAEASKPPQLIGWFMAGAGSVAIVLGWLMAALLAYSGKCLAQKKKRRFSFVMAVVSCLNAPIGTVLGIFTLLVLNRPSVVALYEGTVVDEAPPPKAVKEDSLDHLDEERWKALEEQGKTGSSDEGSTISIKQPENQDAG